MNGNNSLNLELIIGKLKGLTREGISILDTSILIPNTNDMHYITVGNKNYFSYYCDYIEELMRENSGIITVKECIEELYNFGDSLDEKISKPKKLLHSQFPKIKGMKFRDYRSTNVTTNRNYDVLNSLLVGIESLIKWCELESNYSAIEDNLDLSEFERIFKVVNAQRKYCKKSKGNLRCDEKIVSMGIYLSKVENEKVTIITADGDIPKLLRESCKILKPELNKPRIVCYRSMPFIENNVHPIRLDFKS